MTYVLFLGLAVALTLTVCGARASTPPLLRDLAVGAVGAAAGTSVDGDVARTVADRPVAIALGVVATVAVSLAIGQLMRLGPGASGVTVAFSSVPGLAAGVTMIAREYDADTPTVLTLQYLRLLGVALSVPVVAPLLGTHAGGGHGAATAPTATGYALAVITVGGGLALARWTRLPAGPLVFPMLVSTGLELTGWFADAAIPAPMLAVAYAAVGYSVGGELTRDRIRSLAALMPLALAQTALGIAACAAVGLLLAGVIGISPVDGYLATTPGGLPAVAAVAADIGDQVGLVLAMQALRLFLALGVATLMGAWYARRSASSLAVKRPSSAPRTPLEHCGRTR